MLHRRQAPGRDLHKHASLAPARSDTNLLSNPQSAPAIPSTCDSLMAGRFPFGFWCWWALANLARCGRVYV